MFGVELVSILLEILVLYFGFIKIKAFVAKKRHKTPWEKAISIVECHSRCPHLASRSAADRNQESHALLSLCSCLLGFLLQLPPLNITEHLTVSAGLIFAHLKTALPGQCKVLFVQMTMEL